MLWFLWGFFFILHLKIVRNSSTVEHFILFLRSYMVLSVNTRLGVINTIIHTNMIKIKYK